MTFPETPLPIRVDLMIGGTWSDISDDVYSRDSITITRGRTAEGATVDPGRCSLTLNNRSLRYTPRNPMSPLYGLIGRNTPIRVSAGAGSTYLDVPGGGADRASTPDGSAIDILGDLDVRVEGSFENWVAPGNPLELIGKYGVTGNRSWMLTLWNGNLTLYWTTGGTNDTARSSASNYVVPPTGRMAVRATLDVDNGAGGNTVTFYTAPTISGPWTQLGAPLVAAGVTSIFNSTAALDVGAVGAIGFDSVIGRVYAAEVRSGINGTVVANPDFTTQAAGATSFNDSAGRTWAVQGDATISNRQTRFVGEIPAWPLKSDTSGQDVTVAIEAAGILRRLGQGARALDSTLRRRIPTAPELLAYWPMEEGTDATQAASPIAGVAPLSLTHATWASADTLPSSEALPVLASDGGPLSTMSGAVPAPTGSPSGWQVSWLYRLDTPNTTLYTFMRILTTGTVREWYLQTRDNESRILGKNSDGDTLVDVHVATGGDLFNQWNRVYFDVTQTGSTFFWEIVWQDVGGDAGSFDGTLTGTVGRVTAVASPPDGYAGALDGMAIGHVGVFSSAATTAYDGAITAYAGETAGARMQRLAIEENLPVTVYGDVVAQEPLGPQRPDTALNLLEESADADHGILYEARDQIALAYRDRASLYNQTPVQLTYATDLMPPLDPVDDDQLTENDVTVSRVNGSSGRSVLDEGPLSVLPPPDGVGVYASSTTLNLATDDQTAIHAGWLMHLGTVDEPRYPVINLSLARNPELIDRIVDLDSGSRLQILDPPAKLPGGLIDVLVQGYTEVLSQYVWDVQLNCTPGSPYTVGVVEDPDLSRADTAGSQLAAAATDIATALSVATITGPLWVTTAANPTDFPFDVMVGGEVITVTGITGATSPQAFTVVRAVNGIHKPQPSNTDLRLAVPAIVAL